MTAAVADYRDSIDAILATAVDVSTWTTAIKDQALRSALAEYDEYFAYESSLTVGSTDHSQDVSSITGVKDVLAVAYPWADGVDFATRQQRWRYVADQTIYFEEVEPLAGETVRVRHTRAHTLNGLDSALSTMVPDRHQQLLATLAASYACVLRLRQVSENPAIPEQTAGVLEEVSRRLADAASRLFTRARSAEPASWMEIGL